MALTPEQIARLPKVGEVKSLAQKRGAGPSGLRATIQAAYEHYGSPNGESFAVPSGSYVSKGANPKPQPTVSKAIVKSWAEANKMTLVEHGWDGIAEYVTVTVSK